MPNISILPDFIVNSTTTDFQIEPVIATLGDGRIFQVWSSFDSGDGSKSSIRGRFINSDGSFSGVDFVVTSDEICSHRKPSIAVLSNGTIAVSWESADENMNSSSVKTRLFSTTGTPLTSEFSVFETAMSNQYASHVSALSGGRFLVTWDHYGDEIGIGDEIYARIFNNDGTALVSDFIINTVGLGVQFAPKSTTLSNGGFVVIWTSMDGGDGSGTTIRARMFNQEGLGLSGDFIVNSTASDNQTQPTVTQLLDGKIAFVWQSYDLADGDAPCIRARLYDVSGTAIGSDFIVNSTGVVAQSSPAITALADGRFVIAWSSNDTADGSGGCIRARVFNNDGSSSIADFIINTTTDGDQFTPALTALANGDFQVSWTSLDLGDGSNSTIRSTLINPRIYNGTQSSDLWSGGDLIDTIYGNDGNDNLYGKAGNDFIYGGNGSDQLWGGLGADQLIGGDDSGIDIARYDDANYGDLILRLDNSSLNSGDGAVGDTYSGIEGLAGGLGNDTIWGNQFNNYLYGMGGNDIIYGGLGNDSLDGGAGSDTMYGGDGNDIYYVDILNDSVIETDQNIVTGGDDLVIVSMTSGTYKLGDNVERLTLSGTSAINGTGNSLNNVIIGNSAANTLNGGLGNDTLTGGDGNDIYFIDNLNDVVIETNRNITVGGNDLVRFSGISGTYVLPRNIERLDLAGSSNINGTGNNLNNTILANHAANILDGKEGNDTLSGRGGNDTLIGGLGNDILLGGDGADRFQFSSPLDALNNVDTIQDFVHGTDDITLLGSIFSSIGTSLEASEIAFGLSANDSNDYIIYNSVTGQIFYDANGNGAGGQTVFALVTSGTILDMNDFMII
jgi:Ca2+-binding RTX toxin-like protein